MQGHCAPHIDGGRVVTEAALPDDWELVRLGDHFTITSSKRVFQRDWRSSGVPFYRARELAVLGGKGRVENELFIDREMFDRYRRAFGAPSPGDFLVTGVGTLGKTYVVRAGDEFYFKDGNIIWFKASTTVDSSYLNQLYRTPFVLDQVFGNSGGSTVGTYTITNAKLTVVPLPPQKEQAAIAATLADADDLIATLERLIAKKQAIKQGVMQQLLTGRTRLPGFDGRWQDSNLGSVASVTMGQSPAGSTYNSDARGLPLVQGNADIRGRVTFDRIWTSAPTKTCEAGDVLLTVRAPVGYTAIASKRSCLGRGVCSISAHHDNQFIFHALVYAEPAWALYEQGSTFTAVNSNEVRSFALLWPTDPDERRAIARVLDDSDKELASLQARLVKARAIKTGMMQQLLTGRTRLPIEVES